MFLQIPAASSSESKWVQIYEQIKTRYEALDVVSLPNGRFFGEWFSGLCLELKVMTLVKKADHVVWEIDKEAERQKIQQNNSQNNEKISK